MRKRARMIWNKLLKWASEAARQPEVPRPRPKMITGRKAALALSRAREQPVLLECKHLGRVVYAAARAQMHNATFSRWLADTSQKRRWHPSGGEEWGPLYHCTSFTEAHHVIRLLCDGKAEK
eukprot:1464326-Pyramimonas_sp.AAC.1